MCPKEAHWAGQMPLLIRAGQGGLTKILPHSEELADPFPQRTDHKQSKGSWHSQPSSWEEESLAPRKMLPKGFFFLGSEPCGDGVVIGEDSYHSSDMGSSPSSVTTSWGNLKQIPYRL